MGCHKKALVHAAGLLHSMVLHGRADGVVWYRLKLLGKRTVITCGVQFCGQ